MDVLLYMDVWKTELPHWYSAPRDLWKNIVCPLMETPPGVWVLGGLKMWGNWARDTSRCYSWFSLKLLRFRCLFLKSEAPGSSCKWAPLPSKSSWAHTGCNRDVLLHVSEGMTMLWKVLHVNFFFFGGSNSFKDYVEIWKRRIQIRMFIMFQDVRFSYYDY